MTHFHATIETIDHKQQRYDTVGDWQSWPGRYLEIKVSRMSDERYEFLVGVHELLEAYLCKHAGISEASATKFDITFEDKRLAILSVLDASLATTENVEAKVIIQRRIVETKSAEAGDDPRAPYHSQHLFASKIERMIADELGVNWDAYNAEVESK